MADKAILFDTTKCMACRACQVACKQWNGLGAEETSNRGNYENPPDLSPNTLLRMRFIEAKRNGGPAWTFTRQSCMHCTDAACVKVCPTHALYHNDLGMVSYDKNLCSGCGYCVDFCPFHIPRSERDLITGVARMDKCTMCTVPGLDRVGDGLEPACVRTCPPTALRFGSRDTMVAEGIKAVAGLQATGFSNAYLYGERELGGLHVLYVLDDTPVAYGLPLVPVVPAAALAWKDVVQPLGWVLGGLTLVGLGLNYMVARRARLTREPPDKKEEK